MKLILAIIRISKMNETKKALSDAGLPSFTAMGVLGRGNTINSQPEELPVADAEGEEVLVKSRLKAKRMITLVVSDDKKDLAVKTIINTNQTKKSGDGKIFILEALDSVSVRTAEKGDKTLD
ncbi:P-II family nitrogen regulator [Chitinophagaceae bacterium LB-8]|uniref:P-II family nitrogen regulator n=1 Tax=Paraflavisolibacter caeni TaxID=2982496 RepID=A0A9X2XXV4_9BACT|nr:P-II family nitrogen regulator [Paraflavisolibacter caeni]MCU7551130.1 P-II family nitrogen regulator [Paraflavisolibacter caeni]